MKQVILDTNFLMLPFTHKIDIFTEIMRIMDEPYELCILESSVAELGSIISTQSGKHRDAAKMAMQLADEKKIRILHEEKQKSLYMNPNSKSLTVDDIIVNLANKGTIIATQDKFLKERLLAKGIKTIILRGKHKLELRCS